MKKLISNTILVAVLAISMSSCYTYTYTVGSGPQSGVTMKEKNHYLIAGLVALKTSDPIKMAGDSDNYQVTIEHTFVDGLINAITFGIYNPTTTTVTK
ncbi:MAG: Bor family protein [Bacteroidota bacterium]